MSSSTATAGATKVKWLGGDYPPADSPPPKTPLKDMLVGLRVLEKDGETPTLLSTPPSVQVITAGATALVKGWGILVAAGFGGGALAQGLKALDWLPGAERVTGVQQYVLTGSAAVLASATVLAIAMLVRGDVMARATASAAEHQARAAIATALIQSFQYEPAPTPPAEPEPRHLARIRGGTLVPVKHFAWDARKGLVARPVSGNDIPVDEIEWITPTGVWSGSG